METGWKGKAPRGRPTKRCIDIVEADLKDLEVQKWKKIFQDKTERDGGYDDGGKDFNRVVNASEKEDYIITTKDILFFTSTLECFFKSFPKFIYLICMHFMNATQFDVREQHNVYTNNTREKNFYTCILSEPGRTFVAIT